MSVSYHPSAYKSDIHSSAFMTSQWTVVPSFHLPRSRSMAVLLIQYCVQSEPFHTSHSFFLRTNFYRPNLHSVHIPDLPTIPAVRMASYRVCREFDSRVMRVRFVEEKVTLCEGLFLCFPSSFIITQVQKISLRFSHPVETNPTSLLLKFAYFDLIVRNMFRPYRCHQAHQHKNMHREVQ